MKRGSTGESTIKRVSGRAMTAGNIGYRLDSLRLHKNQPIAVNLKDSIL